MSMNELEMFLAWWDREAANTVKVLEALPQTQYDFRPDPGGRCWVNWRGTWRRVMRT
jgi:hypothetical protein